MVDISKVRISKNRFVDGQLEDGRLIEYKSSVPDKFDVLIPQIVAMANSGGGCFIFGINGRTMSFVGIKSNYNLLSANISKTIEEMSIGIVYELSNEIIEEKELVILEIFKAKSTAYLCRTKTTPARQIAYRYSENVDGNVSTLKEEMRYESVYRYMTLETFLASFYRKSWRFFEPSKWNDKFEQRFYCAKYTLPAAMGNTPQLFATCVTKKENSEAAWKVYSNGQGLGAHCLQIKLNTSELRKWLRGTGIQFEERIVKYESEYKILNLHKKSNPYYHEYFGSFTLNSFLNLLSLKRDAYTYEQEVRLFLIPDDEGKRNHTKNAKSKDVPIDWRKIVEKVRVDKQCTDAELVSIQSACFSVGINPIIKKYSFIGSITPPPGCKDVEFERYDIDDMPGKKSISIPKN